MDALPQVGQKYQHKKWGEVEVLRVLKCGRGYQVHISECGERASYMHQILRLKDFQKATA